jgi:hypothetical protein
MTTSSRTDRMKESHRAKVATAALATRDHIDALQATESAKTVSLKSSGKSFCNNCAHTSRVFFYHRCTLKAKLVNPLSVCHHWSQA